jgi:hypothetical protein
MHVAAAMAPAISYDRQVAPLLEKHCYGCHCPDDARSGLDLTRRETMQRGGNELGPAILPGNPEASPLLQVLTGAKEPRMPEGGDALPAMEVELLRRWIAEGARDDTPAFPAEAIAAFERDIRPVLASRCFKCHAGDDAESGLRLTSRRGLLLGGRRGSAVDLDSPKASWLIRALRHETPELDMPRGGDQLNETQILAFEGWIAAGLPWPEHEPVLARERQFTISEADRNHWAFRPLPKELPANWTIDSELQRYRSRIGLPQSPAVDRYRLLRRVTYDLIGFPPTAEEIEAFLADQSSNAWDTVVRRLLNSPHFGWRWGRHWIDYTRNGSCDQSNRGPAFDARRYEQWVAASLQADRPWDWFVRAHIAGDQMPAYEGADYSVDQALAATVPLNGPRTFERWETQTFTLMDKLDEGVEFLGRSLMGVSLECARCHDHKFDPISQHDYYALLGFFQSSGYAAIPEATQSRQAAEAAVAEYGKLIREQAELSGKIRYAAVRLNIQGNGRTKAWQATRTPELMAKHHRLKALEREVLKAELALAEVAGDQRRIAGTRAALTACESILANPSPIDFSVATMKYLGYFLSGHKDQVALLTRARDCRRDDLLAEIEGQADFWNAERERWGEVSRFGGYPKDAPEVRQLVQWDERIREIAEELAIDPRQPFRSPKPGYLLVRCDGGLRREEDLSAWDPEHDQMQFNSDNPERVFRLPPYVGDARLLLRGDVLHPGPLVPRGFPVFFGASSLASEGSGRLQLAEWLTHPGSLQASLVARTAVNRCWQHLFGEGLCRTPKELGRLGHSPELPALIDGLSVRFIASGWSLKELIRELVTSQAYQCSTQALPSQQAQDPDNLYFSRQRVRRLELEAILNSIAYWRSGQRPERPAERDAMISAVADYTQHFDGPSRFDLIDRRFASISASQALFLMNNRHTARKVANDLVDRLGLAEKSGNDDEDLQLLYRSVYQRAASDVELAVVRQLITTLAPDTTNRLGELATLLLCTNEAIYVE